MSIDYKITVMIPSDVDRVFSSDDEFREAIARRLTHSTVSDISCGNIIAEFDTLAYAETAELELSELMELYQTSYDALESDIKKVFYNIVELTACHSVSRMKRVLSGIETNQAFVTFLIDQALACESEQAKAKGEFDYNND
jgi:hypothetical protein